MSEKHVMPPRQGRDGITRQFLSGFTGTREPQDTGANHTVAQATQ